MAAKAHFENAGTVTVSSQGQVVIPKPVREALGLTNGTIMLAFYEPKLRQVLLAHLPDAGELIELSANAARKRGAS